MAKDNRPRTVAANFTQADADQELLDEYLARESASGKSRTDFVKSLMRSAFDSEGGVELARIRALLRDNKDATAELAKDLARVEAKTDQSRRLLADAVAVLLVELAGRSQEDARVFVQKRLKPEG